VAAEHTDHAVQRLKPTSGTHRRGIADSSDPRNTALEAAAIFGLRPGELGRHGGSVVPGKAGEEVARAVRVLVTGSRTWPDDRSGSQIGTRPRECCP